MDPAATWGAAREARGFALSLAMWNWARSRRLSVAACLECAKRQKSRENHRKSLKETAEGCSGKGKGKGGERRGRVRGSATFHEVNFFVALVIRRLLPLDVASESVPVIHLRAPRIHHFPPNAAPETL